MGKFPLLRYQLAARAGQGRDKVLLFVLLLLVLCFGHIAGHAAVAITTPANGVNICSSKAVGGIAPGYTSLGSITITEGANNDFAGSTSGMVTDVIVLNAPSGWQFNTVMPTLTYITGSNVVGFTGSITSSALTLNITVNNYNGADQIMISGLQVQATSTASPAGYIYASSVSGVAGITVGTTGTNFASLSLAALATPSVSITSSPAGAICPGTNVTFTPNPVNGGTSPSYQWTLNGSNVSTAATYSNNSLLSGNTISCTMTSSSGCVSPATATSPVTNITVNPAPAAITGSTSVCPATSSSLSDATASGTWSSTNTSVATVNSSGVVTGVAAGTATISYTVAGCSATTIVYVNLSPVAPVLTPTSATICNGSSVAITTGATPLPVNILSQTFNSGIAPWTVDNSGGTGMLTGAGWKACGDGYVNELGTYHSTDNTQFAMANADTSGSSSYTSSKLISPVFSLAGYSGATLSFQQSYNYWASGDINVNVEISTNGGSTWTVLQNFLGANIGTFTSFPTYTYSLNSYLGLSNLMIRFNYYCHWGYYWALDNVFVTGISSTVNPTWSPATYLFTDAAFTTPYTAASGAGTVYVHPTGVSTVANITYTATAAVPGCSSVRTSTITVNPPPAAIAGIANVCTGAYSTLTDATAGGTWSSSNTSVATISPGGVVNGVAAGTSVVSYTLSTGCAATFTVSVNAVPAAISGSGGVCLGSISLLTDDFAGGAWSSGSPSIVSIDASGYVTGLALGTAAITYSLGTGCITSRVITVNPMPASITGTAVVCNGYTTTFNDASTGGTWSTSSTAIATINSTTGTLTGASAGNVYVSYILPTSCAVVTTATVNPLSPITGVLGICMGTGTTLANVNSGGTWSISSTAVATINSASGYMSAVAFGTATVFYILPTGCTATATITVNPLPVSITGSNSVCAGQSMTLADATVPGTWSSSNTAIATVGPATGIVSGVSAGSVNITYTLPTGCYVISPVTVNPLAPITGTATVCTGQATTLLNSLSGGTWSSASPGTAAISTTGVVSGIVAGTSAVSYTMSSGCVSTVVVTVNSSPAAISGTAGVCQGSTTSLADATTGGIWNTSNSSIATVGGTSGVVMGVSAGTTNITYTILTTGCTAIATVTVNTVPAAISGTAAFCSGNTVTLTNTVPGGTWISSDNTIATISTSGIASGVAGGTATISYSLSAGCGVAMMVTVNQSPSAISGSSSLCIGTAGTFGNTVVGGTWSSSNTSVATIGAASGIVSSATIGTTTISYFLANGCGVSTAATVNPLPLAISGASTACTGNIASLSDASPGGSWSSNNVAVATVGSSAGVVSGISAGIVTIVYTLPTGCTATRPMTVNASPAAISGSSTVCQGTSVTFADATPGGAWTSNNTTVASVGPGNGIVNGLAYGSAIIIYTVPSGCTAVQAVAVNTLPPGITGPSSVCEGRTITLNNTSAGGTWSSSAPSLATVDASGVVTGVAAGAATISYSLGVGCVVVTPVTVNGAPAAIAGITTVCLASPVTLSSTTTGGSWSSANSGIAGISPATAIMVGNSVGATTISYTLSTGCYNTAVVMVNNATPIAGGSGVCQGSTVSLTNASAGGIWSSNNATIAGIGSSSGMVTGYALGTATISYVIAAGCIATMPLTVNPLPAAITGAGSVCVGQSTTLSSTSASGAWSSANSAVASISLAGVVSGIGSGITTLSYTLPTGCYATRSMTVSVIPAAISGTANTCAGSTTILTDVTAGGTWSSANASIGDIGSATGVVTGIAGGTTAMTYTMGPGCYATTSFTVNPLPAGISGSSAVCAGLNISLSDVTPGGTWSVSPSSVAGINAAGLLTGISAGSCVVTYTLSTGCYITTAITVNAAASITGSSSVCAGSAITLADVTASGTWSSSAPSQASVDASGVVIGVAAGAAIVTYKAPTGCIATLPLTVNPLPAAITGASSVCIGSATPLNDVTPAGTWSTGNPLVALVGFGSGMVSGIAAGVATITYKLPTGCAVARLLTVNPLPASISGSASLCAGLTVSLTDATSGGSWSSSNTSVVTVGNTNGIVSGLAAGTSAITYTLPTGCSVSVVETVNNLMPVSGITTLCQAQSSTLSNPVTGGIWSVDNSTVATVGASNAVVTAVSAGTAMVSYNYSVGCTATAMISVNPLPAAISGTMAICEGAATPLTNITAGGTWSSLVPAAAVIDGATGIVSAIAAGNTTIIYTLPSGCYSSASFTVNPLPAAIAGSTTVCAGLTSSLSDATPLGMWASANTSVATVNASSGIATGIAAGVVQLTYTLATGCMASTTLTVYPLPASVEAPAALCAGSSAMCSIASSGGSWSSSNTTVAVINPVSGNITGMSAGTVTITYTLPTGCISTAVVTIDPLPATITGLSGVCVGSTIPLADATAGGNWGSSNMSAATIDASGVLSGLSAGTTIVSYALPTGCTVYTSIMVHPLPLGITGPSAVCVASAIAVSDATGGGAWSTLAGTGSGAISVAGVFSGVSAGLATVVYTLPTGCKTSASVLINPLPAAIEGASSVCAGGITALTDATSGGIWTSSGGVLAIGSSTGMVSGVSVGSAVVSYTLPTGCAVSAVVGVDPAPLPVTGITAVCASSTTNLSDATPGGVWSSSNSSTAYVGLATGTVTGISAGTTIVYYTLSNGCRSAIIVTVHPLPAYIVGATNMCVGSTATLFNGTPGGAWTSGNVSVATVNSGTGVVNAVNTGAVGMTYTLPTGCITTTSFSVNPVPAAISGTSSLCPGGTATLSCATAGGTWSSSLPSAVTVSPSGGIINAVVTGTATVSYYLSTGCASTRVITVNSVPAAITGPYNACYGVTTTLSSAPAGGTWLASNANVSVSPGGVVTGLAYGSAVITYTLPTACFTTMMVSVNPSPAGIAGPVHTCNGYTVALSDATSGGMWSSANAAVATVGSFSGIVSATAAGTAAISYMMPTGCYATHTITVDSLAPVTGISSMCITNMATLADAVGGGAWSSSTLSVCTVNPLTGSVYAVAPGTAVISYLLTSGCIASLTMTVNPPPASYNITGGGSYCSGTTGVHIGLDGSASSILYRLYRGAALAASVMGAGSALDFGIFSDTGSYTATAYNTVTGCTAVMYSAAHVSYIPYVPPVCIITPVSGTSFCAGATGTFYASAIYGGASPVYQWAVNGTAAGSGTSYSYVPANGDVLSCRLTSSAGCLSATTDTAYATLHVYPYGNPSVSITAAPGDTLCAATPVSFSPVPAYGGSTPGYLWFKNGIFADAGAVYNYIPSSGDVVYCTMVSSYMCRLADTVSSNHIALYTIPQLIPSVSVNATPGLSITAGQSDTLNAVVSGGGTAPVYMWLLNGAVIPGATSSSLISNFSNNDSVVCIVTSTGTCGGNSDTSLAVIRAVPVSVPGTHMVHPGITVVPNPSAGNFEISCQLNSSADLNVPFDVTNVLGQTIYSDVFPCSGGKIFQRIALPQNIADGLYWLSLHTFSGKLSVSIFIKH